MTDDVSLVAVGLAGADHASEASCHEHNQGSYEHKATDPVGCRFRRPGESKERVRRCVARVTRESDPRKDVLDVVEPGTHEGKCDRS